MNRCVDEDKTTKNIQNTTYTSTFWNKNTAIKKYKKKNNKHKTHNSNNNNNLVILFYIYGFACENINKTGCRKLGFLKPKPIFSIR